MTTITKEVVIPPDRRITVEPPGDWPSGNARITLTVEATGSAAKRGNRMRELFGKYEGRFHMAPDFTAPLDEFKEYME